MAAHYDTRRSLIGSKWPSYVDASHHLIHHADFPPSASRKVEELTIRKRRNKRWFLRISRSTVLRAIYVAINAYRMTRILFRLLTKYFLRGYRYRALYDICASCARNISYPRTLSSACTEISFGKFAEKGFDSARKSRPTTYSRLANYFDEGSAYSGNLRKVAHVRCSESRVRRESPMHGESDSIGIEITGFTRV